MKKVHLIAVLLALVSLLFFVSCTMTDLTKLPKGELTASYDSPSHAYTLNMYLCGEKSSTGFLSFRGELFTHADNSRKNIYWMEYECGPDADVVWLDENTVRINGRVLDVSRDLYDGGSDLFHVDVFLGTYDSPTRAYAITIFQGNGGATVDYSIKAELFDYADNSSKNIYWAYHESEANVVWLDEDTVRINGRVIDVLLR